MTRPTCEDFPEDEYAESWESCFRHDGWKHADSWQEIHNWLNSTPEEVFDYDGDPIVSVTVDEGLMGHITHRCASQGRPEEEGYYGTSNPGYILVPDPDLEPVTEEELAEVYKSLGVMQD